jgi:hypothetical protein
MLIEWHYDWQRFVPKKKKKGKPIGKIDMTTTSGKNNEVYGPEIGIAG